MSDSEMLRLEVVELSAEVAAMKEVLTKMLAVQERQEGALKTVAACLEKMCGAFGTDHRWSRNVLFTSVVNNADFPY